MDCEDQVAINFMDKVKAMKAKMDSWYAQSQRDLTMVHPHPYSSAIDGNWLFVTGKAKTVR